MKAERGETLTELEDRRLTGHYSVFFSLVYSKYVQRELAEDKRFLTRDDLDIQTIARGRGGQPRLWWEKYGPQIYPEMFVYYINDRIAGIPVTIEPQATPGS